MKDTLGSIKKHQVFITCFAVDDYLENVTLLFAATAEASRKNEFTV
jgi:hypothetical protein